MTERGLKAHEFSFGSIRCPVDWQDKSTIAFVEPAHLYSSLPTMRPGRGFRANLTINARRPVEPKGLDESAAAVRTDALSTFVGGRATELKPFALDCAAPAVAFEVTGDVDGTALVQHYVLLFHNEVLLVLTSTCDAGRWSQMQHILVACARSFVPAPSL